jgi:hypothetical protein
MPPCAAQVVTDAQWEARAERFPDQPPKTREYYLLRAIFQKHFPSKSAYETVPRVRKAVVAYPFGVGCLQDCGSCG